MPRRYDRAGARHRQPGRFLYECHQTLATTHSDIRSRSQLYRDVYDGGITSEAGERQAVPLGKMPATNLANKTTCHWVDNRIRL
jgi:hypothetical protein